MKRYFIANCNENDEADVETVFEIDLNEMRDQINREVQLFMAGFKSISNKRIESVTEDLCEIVDKNFDMED